MPVVHGQFSSSPSSSTCSSSDPNFHQLVPLAMYTAFLHMVCYGYVVCEDD